MIIKHNETTFGNHMKARDQWSFGKSWQIHSEAKMCGRSIRVAGGRGRGIPMSMNMPVVERGTWWKFGEVNGINTKKKR